MGVTGHQFLLVKSSGILLKHNIMQLFMGPAMGIDATTHRTISGCSTTALRPSPLNTRRTRYIIALF